MRAYSRCTVVREKCESLRSPLPILPKKRLRNPDRDKTRSRRMSTREGFCGLSLSRFILAAAAGLSLCVGRRMMFGDRVLAGNKKKRTNPTPRGGGATCFIPFRVIFIFLYFRISFSRHHDVPKGGSLLLKNCFRIQTQKSKSLQAQSARRATKDRLIAGLGPSVPRYVHT